MKLAELLRESRSRLGLSRREVQSATGIHAQYLAQFERGANTPGAGYFCKLVGLYRLSEAEALSAYKQDYPDKYEKFVYQYAAYKYGCNAIDEGDIWGFLKRPARFAAPDRLVALALQYAELGVLREIELKCKECDEKGKSTPLLNLANKYKRKFNKNTPAERLRANQELPQVFKSPQSQTLMKLAEDSPNTRNVLKVQALESAAQYYLAEAQKACEQAESTEEKNSLISQVILNSRFANQMAIACMKQDLPIAGCEGFPGLKNMVEAVEN